MSRSPRVTRLLSRLAALAMMAGVAACGWHLRGSFALPDYMSVTEVAGSLRYADIKSELGRALENAGATVTDDSARATAVLTVHDEGSERRVLSVGTGGRAQEYQLRYTLTFSVRRPDVGIVIPRATVTQTREYNFDTTNVLGKSTEEDQLRQDMRRQAVYAVLRRIQFSSGEPAAAPDAGEVPAP